VKAYLLVRAGVRPPLPLSCGGESPVTRQFRVSPPKISKGCNFAVGGADQGISR